MTFSFYFSKFEISLQSRLLDTLSFRELFAMLLTCCLVQLFQVSLKFFFYFLAMNSFFYILLCASCGVGKKLTVILCFSCVLFICCCCCVHTHATIQLFFYFEKRARGRGHKRKLFQPLVSLFSSCCVQ